MDLNKFKIETIMKYCFFLLFFIVVSCKKPSSSLQLEQQRWSNHALNTEIIRDDFGVPHIYGKTDADAVFGLLYAQCEDDFNRVERNYIWATGRLAEVEPLDGRFWMKVRKQILAEGGFAGTVAASNGNNKGQPLTGGHCFWTFHA